MNNNLQLTSMQMIQLRIPQIKVCIENKTHGDLMTIFERLNKIKLTINILKTVR